MSKIENPALQRFPQQEAQIKELMKREKDFACICRDYAEIVYQISETERSTGQSVGALADLIELRSDLERDILDRLA